MVTESGTVCVDPDTLPPEPVAVGTPWELPVVADGDTGEWWWVPPLALLHHETVTLLEWSDGGRLAATPWAAFDLPAEEMHVASDGSIVVQQLDPDGDEFDWTDVVVHRPDGTSTPVPDADWLFDVAFVGDTEVVVVSASPGAADSEPDEQLQMRPLGDLASELGVLGPATAAEYGVGWVDIVGDLAVTTAWADLTEWVEYRDLGTGETIPLPSPTDDLAYNQPPYVVAATLSPDGERVTWAEGPDWDGVTGDVVPAPWRVETMRLADGVEILSWPASEELLDAFTYQVHSIHDLGGHLVVNFVEWQAEAWSPRPAIVIDLTAEEPESWSLPYAGIAVPVPYSRG
jgi:hypothetical protein